MAQPTVRGAKRQGIAIGPHPRLPDRQGFGRRVTSLTRHEVSARVPHQTVAPAGSAAAQDVSPSHKEPHDALFGMAQRQQTIADGPDAAEALDLPPEPGEKIEEVREAWLEALTILYEAGVPMAYGLEMLVDMHRHQFDEFTLCGRRLPTMNMIRSATLNAGCMLRMERSVATVAPGAFTGLFVDGVPPQDASLLRGGTAAERRPALCIGYVPKVANAFAPLTAADNLEVVEGVGDRRAAEGDRGEPVGRGASATGIRTVTDDPPSPRKRTHCDLIQIRTAMSLMAASALPDRASV